MKNIFTKLLKIVGITALAGLFLWGGAYLVSPKVKEWTNTNIFHIEQTVEDENKDETPEDETNGDETNGDESEEGKTDIVPAESTEE